MPVVLPELGASIAAAFLMLIAAALWVLSRMIVNPFSHLPLVGGWIGRSLGSWIEHERESVISEAKSSFAAGAHLINWLSGYLWTMIDKVLAVMVQDVTSWDWLTSSKLPAMLAHLEGYALNRAAAAQIAAEQWAEARFSTLASDLTKVQQQADAAIKTVSADLTKAVATAEAKAAAISAGLYTDLEDWGKLAVTTGWPDAARDIDGLRAALGADFPQIRDLLPALAGAGAAGLAGTLIRSMASAATVTRLAEDCIVPQCRNLGGFSTMLGDLLGAGSLAALVAFLAEGVADPGGWARDVQSVADPLGRKWAAAGAGMFGAP